jgi:hypothetical protein
MTGNGQHITYKHGDDCGRVYGFSHINPNKTIDNTVDYL